MYIPRQYKDTVRLIFRLIKKRNKNAYSAMAYALLGILFAPLDLYWLKYEKRRYDNEKMTKQPILIVVGPPRSGTSLFAQSLVATSNSAYFNNLTSIFPRSPIEANFRLAHLITVPKANFSFFYGKTVGLGAFNDGLHLWDRWLGDNRSALPNKLSKPAIDDMQRFFSAFAAHYKRPIVCKINRLDSCANLVAEILSNTKFICLQRDPVNLALSLYRARKDITGNMDIPYGIDFSFKMPSYRGNPMRDVAEQVRFHHQIELEQFDKIGPNRFKFVKYELFCNNPRKIIQSMLKWGFNVSPSDYKLRILPKNFIVSQPKSTDSYIYRYLLQELGNETSRYRSDLS
jgi:hypothetical protein